MFRSHALTLAALAALLFTAAPAAASQQVTEVITSFDQPVAALAVSMSSRPEAGSQDVTEAIASFDETVEAPAIVMVASGAGPQAVTEVVAAFDDPSHAVRQGAAVASAPVAPPDDPGYAAAQREQASAPARQAVQVACACPCR